MSSLQIRERSQSSGYPHRSTPFKEQDQVPRITLQAPKPKPNNPYRVSNVPFIRHSFNGEKNSTYHTQSSTVANSLDLAMPRSMPSVVELLNDNCNVEPANLDDFEHLTLPRVATDVSLERRAYADLLEIVTAPSKTPTPLESTNVIKLSPLKATPSIKRQATEDITFHQNATNNSSKPVPLLNASSNNSSSTLDLFHKPTQSGFPISSPIARATNPMVCNTPFLVRSLSSLGSNDS